MDFEKAREELHSLLESEPNDPECAELRVQLRNLQTVSDLAAFTKDNFETMFEHLRYMLTDYICECLSPEVCARHGLLVNPERMPNPISYDGYIAIADGSVKTIQDTPACVTYYGNVDLTISQGSAIVMDTCHPVTAEGKVSLVVKGDTVVDSTGPITLYLSDCARATVDNANAVLLVDRAFLESTGGDPWIIAGDQAQYVVSTGSAHIEQSGCARGTILNKANPDARYHVLVKDSSLLFIENSETLNCKVSQLSGKNAVINGSVNEAHKTMLLDAIVPWRKQKAEYIHLTEIGREPNVIRENLEPYLPELDKQQRKAWIEADNEYDLCRQIKDWIPEMVEKGLTGDILRQNFGRLALNAANIYPGQNKWSPAVNNKKLQYFFGDQLVNAIGCKEPVYCYENTLLLARDNKAAVFQSASVIGLNKSKIVARDNARAFIFNQSKLKADGHVTAWGTHQTGIEANGFSTVYGTDDAHLEGHDHAWLELYGYSTATAEQDCRVISVGECQIETVDNAKVWQASYVNDCEPTLIAHHNAIDQVSKIESLDEYKALRSEWEQAASKEVHKSAGVRR